MGYGKLNTHHGGTETRRKAIEIQRRYGNAAPFFFAIFALSAVKNSKPYR
jgi:hypothetical protein